MSLYLPSVRVVCGEPIVAPAPVARVGTSFARAPCDVEDAIAVSPQVGSAPARRAGDERVALDITRHVAAAGSGVERQALRGPRIAKRSPSNSHPLPGDAPAVRGPRPFDEPEEHSGAIRLR